MPLETEPITYDNNPILTSKHGQKTSVVPHSTGKHSQQIFSFAEHCSLHVLMYIYWKYWSNFFSHEGVAATANLVLASCLLTVLAYPAYLLGVNDMLLKEKLTRYENRCYHLYEINSYSLIFQINESWICCQST